MLNVVNDFIRDFSRLPKEEQIEKAKKMNIEELDVLRSNGYAIEIGNGEITDVILERAL